LTQWTYNHLHSARRSWSYFLSNKRTYQRKSKEGNRENLWKITAEEIRNQAKRLTFFTVLALPINTLLLNANNDGRRTKE